jgi:hypothetical protein
MSYKEVVEAEGPNAELLGDDGVLDRLKSALVDKIKVRVDTTLFSEETQPFKPGEQAKPNLALSLLKPKITITDPAGTTLYTAAPYGDPMKDGGVVKVGFVAAVLGAFGAAFGLGRLSKRK